MKAFKKCISVFLVLALLVGLLPMMELDISAAMDRENFAKVSAGQTLQITTQSGSSYARTNLIFSSIGDSMGYLTVYDKDDNMTEQVRFCGNLFKDMTMLSGGVRVVVDVIVGGVSVDGNYMFVNRPVSEIRTNDLAPEFMVKTNITKAYLTVGESLDFYISQADTRYFVEQAADYTSGNYINGFYTQDRSVAIVDKEGKITAKGPGETEIVMAYKFGFSETEYLLFSHSCTIDVIGDYGVAEAYKNYYAAGNDKYFNVVAMNDGEKRSTGFDIQVGDTLYNTGNTYEKLITFPAEYTADVVISKEGYVPCTLKNEHISSYNWVTLYPENDGKPIIQSVLGRSAESDEWHNLKVRSLNAFEESGEEFVIDVTVDWRDEMRNEIWLQCGDRVIPVVDGSTGPVALGLILPNSGERMYVCARSASGMVVKSQILVNVLSPEKIARLDFGDSGGLEATYTGGADCLHGLPFSMKLSGNIPFEYTVDQNGKVKGTLGVKIGLGENKYTYYEDIKGTILTTKSFGSESQTRARNKEVLELYNRLEKSGATISKTQAQFAVNGDVSFLGYVEGKLVEGKLQVEEMGVLCVVSAGAELSRQSIAFSVPYYWTLGIKAELEVPIQGLQRGEDGKFQVTIPQITMRVSLDAGLYLGTKLTHDFVRLGVKMSASLSVTLPPKGGQMSDSVWTINASFAPVTELGQFEHTDSAWETVVDWQIYPYEDAEVSGPFTSLTDASNYTMIPRSAAMAAMTFGQRETQWDGEHLLSMETVAANSYQNGAPQIVHLEDRDLMVWLVDDTTRAPENRTCLYYAVYDQAAETWSTPAAVLDDGKMDCDPVLQCIGGKAYLAWSKASETFGEGVTMTETARKLDIYYAGFDPVTNTFTQPQNVSGDNGVYDANPRIVSTDRGITVVWVQNSESDVFGREGTNSLWAAVKTETGWAAEALLPELDSLNDFTAYARDGALVVCYGADTDGDAATDQDRELFLLQDGTRTQLTENAVMDSLPVWHNGTLYRYEDGLLSDGESLIPNDAEGLDYVFASNADGSFRAVLYTVGCGGLSNQIYASINDGSGWSQGVPVLTLENTCITDFTAYFSGTELVALANCREVGENLELGRTRIVKSVKTVAQDLAVSDATHQVYTLVEGGTLKGSVDVTNNGLHTVERFTVTVTDPSGNVLSVNDCDTRLLPGQTLEAPFYCPVSDIPDEGLVIGVSSDGLLDANGENDRTELEVYKDDVSVENAFAQQLQGVTTVNAFVVNRGLRDLTGLELTFRKDGPEGTVLGTASLESLERNASSLVTFTTTEAEAYDTIYVSAGELEHENIYANNYDFAVAQPYLEDVVTEDVVELPQKLDEAPVEQDYTYYLTADNSTTDTSGIFVPEHDGYYRLRCTQYDFEDYPYADGDAYIEETATITIDKFTARDGDKYCYIMDKIYYLEAGKEYTVACCVQPHKAVEVEISALEQVPPQSITLNYDSVELDEGQTWGPTLEAIFDPDDSFGRVSFTSSDEAVATLDAENQIIPHLPGTAVITATVEGSTATAQCQVVVRSVPKIPLTEGHENTCAAKGVYVFTPEQTGMYQVTISAGVAAASYDAGWNPLSADWSYRETQRTKDLLMEAGESYYFEITRLPEGETATCTVSPYQYLSLGQLADVRIESDCGEVWYQFTPQKDGRYEFFSLGDGSAIGYLYDTEKNLLSEYSEGDNFNLEYRLKAGRIYLLKAWFCSFTSSDFQVGVEPAARYLERMELLSLPEKMDYLQGFAAENLQLDGLKVRFVWSDGTFTDWSEGDSIYVEGLAVTYDTEQTDTTGLVKVCCDGLEVGFNVNLQEHPVASIEVDASTVPSCVEGYDGYMDSRYNEATGEYEEYFCYNYPYRPDLTVTIHYTDGTSKTVQTGGKVDGYWFSCSTQQSEKPWTLGGENQATLEYMGIETTFLVPVLPNPVASVEVVSGPTMAEYTSDYVPYFPGTVIRINYTDGTSKTVTLTRDNLELSYDAFAPLCQRVMVDGYPLEIEKSWNEDVDGNSYYVSYLGHDCLLDDFISVTEPRAVASVAVENATLTGEGMVVHVTYADGGTETLRFDQVACGSIPDTEVLGVYGYADTPNGLLSYTVEAYLDDDGNITTSYVRVLGHEIPVTISQVLRGDVNSDGVVNSKDVTMLRRYLVGGWNTTIDMAAADVNDDGIVNSKDVTMLRRYLVGGWGVALN